MSKSLYEQINEDEAKLAELEKTNPDDTIDPQVKAKAEAPVDELTADEDNADGQGDEPKPEDKPADKPEDKPADAKPEGDDKLPNNEAAQLRIERKQRKELEARLAALQPQTPVAQPHPTTLQPAVAAKTDGAEGQQPSTQTALEERLAAIEARNQQQEFHTAVVTEFTNHEREFAKTTPDYDAASAHMVGRMAESAKALYPTATDQQIGAFLQRQILTIASQAAQKGLNPAETLYLMAHDRYGYTGQPAAQPKVDAAATQKRLDTVKNNSRRSTTPLTSTGGTGSPKATIEEAASMDLSDFSNLPASEIERMIADLQR